MPITPTSVDELGVELIFGFAVAIANALQIPKTPIDAVIKDKDTGQPIPVTVSQAMPAYQLRQAESNLIPSVPVPSVQATQKSKLLAYVLWLFLGFLGGIAIIWDGSSLDY